MKHNRQSNSETFEFLREKMELDKTERRTIKKNEIKIIGSWLLH